MSSTQLELLLLQDQIVDSIEFLENKRRLDPILLHEKYIKKGLSISQIAAEFDFSKNTVRNTLIKLGIPLREQHCNHGNRSKLTYGFQNVNGKSVPNEGEQKIIQAIIDFRQREQLSFHKIAKYLNKIGVPTKTKLRQGWGRETVRNIYDKWSKLKQI